MIGRKKVIMHLVSTSNYSAVARVAENIARYSSDYYQHFYVAPDGKVFSALSDDIMKSPLKHLSIKEVALKITKIKPDIVHAHDVKATVIIGILKYLTHGNFTFISQLHSNDKKMRRISFRFLSFVVVLPMINHVVLVSEKILHDSWINHVVRNDNITVIDNIVSVAELDKVRRKWNDRNVDVVISARLTDVKNPQRMISVLARVIQQVPTLTVSYLGDGELESQIKNLVSHYGIQNNIHFYGRLLNPYPYMADAKLGLMLSKSEGGVPLAARELLGLGSPVVATPAVFNPKIDSQNLTVHDAGFVSDSDADIVEFIIDLLKNNQKRERFSYNASHRFTILNDIESFREKIRMVYREKL